MESAWDAWLRAEQIHPLRVTYEALSDAPYTTLGRVPGAPGLAQTSGESSAFPVAKLADATSRDWAKRFMDDARE